MKTEGCITQKLTNSIINFYISNNHYLNRFQFLFYYYFTIFSYICSFSYSSTTRKNIYIKKNINLKSKNSLLLLKTKKSLNNIFLFDSDLQFRSISIPTHNRKKI